MSQVYNTEPPTSGKVILKTSLGDIDIELWPKEAPKAVRNFVQLCLEGYYDGCAFHRVMRGFLAQGGDPTGSGAGGESVYGRPFADEFHSRLRFCHRGLVACANANAPHTNGSQFFFTFDRCDHLDRKNTIFGRITGESIYNAMSFDELEVDEEDRPLQPPLVLGAEVLWNPFEDIVPRSTREDREAAAAEAREREEAAVRAEKKGRKKNLALLSFAEDEGGKDADGAAAATRGIASAHDRLDDARLVRQNTEAAQDLAAREAAAEEERRRVRARLTRAAPAQPAPAAAAGEARSGEAHVAGGPPHEAGGGSGFGASMHARALARRRAMGDEPRPEGDAAARPGDGDEDANDDDDADAEPGPNSTAARRGEALKGSATAAIVRPSKQVLLEDAELLTTWQRRQAEYKARRKLTGKREADILSRLTSFQSKVRRGDDGLGLGRAAAPPEAAQAEPSGHQADIGKAYAGQVREDIDHEALKPAAWRVDGYLEGVEEEDLSLGALRGHRLAFPKGPDARDKMARRDDGDDLMVVDPLLEKGKAKWNKAQAKAKKRQTEWASGRRDAL
ncbi:hypothetical protein WJX81_002949 [Elliptochloris bilobata]|uniref:PPIase cyclophilin-type domain-containing protein n=1 Tax=Elliptochloris bilobata TaxID=381761 RepID=A0AAW1SLH0_9CHLO